MVTVDNQSGEAGPSKSQNPVTHDPYTIMAEDHDADGELWFKGKPLSAQAFAGAVRSNVSLGFYVQDRQGISCAFIILWQVRVDQSPSPFCGPKVFVI